MNINIDIVIPGTVFNDHTTGVIAEYIRGEIESQLDDTLADRGELDEISVNTVTDD